MPRLSSARSSDGKGKARVHAGELDSELSSPVSSQERATETLAELRESVLKPVSRSQPVQLCTRLYAATVRSSSPRSARLPLPRPITLNAAGEPDLPVAGRQRARDGAFASFVLK